VTAPTAADVRHAQAEAGRVRRGEGVEAKAARLLAQGRLKVLAVAPGLVDAVCQGDHATYQLAYRPGGWSCECEASRHSRRCAHLAALLRVVDRPAGRALLPRPTTATPGRGRRPPGATSTCASPTAPAVRSTALGAAPARPWSPPTGLPTRPPARATAAWSPPSIRWPPGREQPSTGWSRRARISGHRRARRQRTYEPSRAWCAQWASARVRVRPHDGAPVQVTQWASPGRTPYGASTLRHRAGRVRT
jgi:hypothetical protein